MEAEDSTLSVHVRYAVPLEVADPLLDHKSCEGDLGEEREGPLSYTLHATLILQTK